MYLAPFFIYEPREIGRALESDDIFLGVAYNTIIPGRGGGGLRPMPALSKERRDQLSAMTDARRPPLRVLSSTPVPRHHVLPLVCTLARHR